MTTLPHAPDLTPHSFTSPPTTHPFTALLFDMDGTIIDSTPAIIKHWKRIGAAIGVDPATILETSHGRRSIDVLALLAPELATWDYVREAEARVPREWGGDAVEIPGARGLLGELERSGVPWAIVTSGTGPLVQGWLEVMALAKPRVLVTAEMVREGKPAPACYRLGMERLGVSGGIDGDGEGEGALVLEDAPAGVRAGKAAGFRVLAVATTHEVGRLREAGADWIVRDLRSVRVVGWEGGKGVVRVEIRDALVE
ncbi:hypothetical protein MBLNU230_g7627t1 [Neophaeotheca triangularis]